MLIHRLAHHIWKNSPWPISLWPIKSWFGWGISLKVSTRRPIWYDPNKMKMTSKLQNNYSKTLCHEFPRICCPQIPNKSLQLIGFDLKGPGQIEGIGRIWPLRLPISALITFLGSLNGVNNQEREVLVIGNMVSIHWRSGVRYEQKGWDLYRTTQMLRNYN